MNVSKVELNLGPFGLAVKEARKSKGMTREQLAEQIGLSVRHLAGIENNGWHPRIQVFFQLATLFDISVDQYFYPHSEPKTSTKRRQINATLDKLPESKLDIVQGTLDGILKCIDSSND